MSFAICTIYGRLGKDPEVRNTPTGAEYCYFSVATNKKKKDGTEETYWHNMVAFGKTCKLICEHLGKGSEAMFLGNITYYKDKNDIIRCQIMVSQLEFVGKGKSSGVSKQEPFTPPDNKSSEHLGTYVADDIPF